jgi:diacylglycerol O-acyltransferase
VMAAFFDLSPQPAPRSLFGAPGRRRSTRRSDRDEEGTPAPEGDAAPSDPSWTPEPLPGEVERWRHVIGSLPGAAESVLRTVSNTLRSARVPGGANIGPGTTVPPQPFEAPRTSINRAISPHRRVAFAELPLSDVRRIRQGLGGTANDVVLAVTSGAMRRFFAQRGEEPDTSLVAMVPVSVRVESERDTLGNRVSALLVSLANGVEDAPARLRQIRQGMQSAKEKNRSSDSEVFTEWAEVVFPAVATRLSRLVTNLRVFDHLAPMFNLIVSNVPGPDFALYLAGARMVAMYPVGPIVEGVGVNVTVFSYLDTMYVGIHGCWELAPDIEVIAAGMRDSLDELVQAADRPGRPVPWWHAELPA